MLYCISARRGINVEFVVLHKFSGMLAMQCSGPKIIEVVLFSLKKEIAVLFVYVIMSHNESIR